MFTDQGVERGPAERTCENNTLVLTVIDHFPTFSIVISVAECFVEFRFQTSATPKVSLEERLKAEWVEHRIAAYSTVSLNGWFVFRFLFAQALLFYSAGGYFIQIHFPFFAAGPLIFCACSQCSKCSELFAESIVVIIDRLGLGNPNFFCIALQQTIEGPVL